MSSSTLGRDGLGIAEQATSEAFMNSSSRKAKMTGIQEETERQ